MNAKQRNQLYYRQALAASQGRTDTYEVSGFDCDGRSVVLTFHVSNPYTPVACRPA